MELGLNHFRTIVLIADAGSIRRAATRLGVSQPAVSQTLNRIEDHLGDSLFTRTRHGVEVTIFGRAVLPEIRVLLADFERLSNLAGVGKGKAGSINLGGQICTPLAEVVPRLEELFPRRDLQVYLEPDSAALMARTSSGQLDISVLLEAPGFEFPIAHGVDYKIVSDWLPLLVALPPGHRLSELDVIPLRCLADETWIYDGTNNGGTAAYFRAVCRDAGFSPRIKYWLTDSYLSERLVNAGIAIGLFYAGSRARGITLRGLQDAPIGARLVICWRPGFRDAADVIYHELRRACEASA